MVFKTSAQHKWTNDRALGCTNVKGKGEEEESVKVTEKEPLVKQKKIRRESCPDIQGK